MRVYLAARYSRKDEMEGYKDVLQREGIEVVSRWHDQSHVLDPVKAADIDLVDLSTSDVLVAFAEEARGGSRGGRHVEFGFALASGMGIILVGEPEHVFHHLEEVHRATDIGEVVMKLDGFG
jgi:hypothetical protein